VERRRLDYKDKIKNKKRRLPLWFLFKKSTVVQFGRRIK